ncbi:16S rRNA (cytosine(1402)-N(4))-methyltransferase RsmH, partial [Candidatus Berkelbacteria bacterium]|nr:16S rRNA (cytosine(1402)-N(4))-methyltransferase RsmH [Candidatus Berkelbacteria bacterium]
IANAQPKFPAVTLIHGNFAELGNLLNKAGIKKFDGIVADLGFSSPQMADAGRGFSFQKIGPLDMRYDNSQSLTAAEIVNHWNEVDIARIIKDYSGERFAERIARAIVRHRPVTSTIALAQLIEQAVPVRRKGHHAATRTFQALRIAVNSELDSLEALLKEVPLHANPGARAAFIAFHSLEDIKIRAAMRRWAKQGLGEILTKKPIVPTAQEIHANPRSRSAHLWVFRFN